MNGDFVYEALPMRVVFRPGAATTAVAPEAARLGLRRLLVLRAPAASALLRPWRTPSANRASACTPAR